jgi:hypothetical protein
VFPSEVRGAEALVGLAVDHDISSAAISDVLEELNLVLVEAPCHHWTYPSPLHGPSDFPDLRVASYRPHQDPQLAPAVILSWARE